MGRVVRAPMTNSGTPRRVPYVDNRYGMDRRLSKPCKQRYWNKFYLARFITVALFLIFTLASTPLSPLRSYEIISTTILNLGTNTPFNGQTEITPFLSNDKTPALRTPAPNLPHRSVTQEQNQEQAQNILTDAGSVDDSARLSTIEDETYTLPIPANSNFVHSSTQNVAHYTSLNPDASLPAIDVPADFPHQCYLQAPSDVPSDVSQSESYPFNARSFCLTSSICFKPAKGTTPSTFYPAASLSQTKCIESTAAFDPYPEETLNCSYIQSLVHCGHGRYAPPRQPICPIIKPLFELSPSELAAARWINGVVFFVPDFPHLKNIFHFSFIAGSVGHILSAITTLIQRWRQGSIEIPKPLPVTIMFRGAPHLSFGVWQDNIMSTIIKHRLQSAGMEVSFSSMNESSATEADTLVSRDSLTCARTAVLLGTRSHINLWPFPLTTWVTFDGSSVPVESVAFRNAAYGAYGIASKLPSLPEGALTPPPSTALFDLPPMSIGYSRRNFHPDPTKENPIQMGTKRRFSDADEAWFVSMLQDVAERNNFSFATLQTTASMSMDDQMTQYANTGFVVGIHGANLMNAIFMRPFGGLLEILPGFALQCYAAGANSGLAYSTYITVKTATGEESGCPKDHNTCWTLIQARRVKIEEEADHRELRERVEKGVARIKMLHHAFGRLGGIPVFYDKNSTSYRIDWSHR